VLEVSLRLFVSIALVVLARDAFADLYRWVDPDSGSVKFSSYPPPWYSESAPDRRAPKVERIPEKSAPTPFAPASANTSASAGGSELAALESQRRAVLQMIEATLEESNRPTADSEVRRQLGIYRDVSAQLDKLDPAGSAARNTQMQRFVERLGRRFPQ
jgi:hypothetical protein